MGTERLKRLREEIGCHQGRILEEGLTTNTYLAFKGRSCIRHLFSSILHQHIGHDYISNQLSNR
jgi:hypothetical protein